MNTHIKSCAIVALTASCTLLGSHVALGQTATLYVDIESEATTPDGLSWTTAFSFLQDGLTEAKLLIDFDPNVSDVDIWVAAGVYKPDHDSSNPTGSCSGSPPFIICDPNATFLVPSNVRIFGGFDSQNPENSLADRTHDPSKTILTGDLADGKSSQFSAYSNNVVTFDTTDSTARLDTVTIKRGWERERLVRRLKRNPQQQHHH